MVNLTGSLPGIFAKYEQFRGRQFLGKFPVMTPSTTFSRISVMMWSTTSQGAQRWAASMSSLSPRHDDHHPPQVDAYSRGPRAYHDIERILEECGGVPPELLVGNALAGDEFNCLVLERFVFSLSRSIRRWYPLSRQTMIKVGFEGRKCIIPGCNGKVKGTFSSTGRVTVSVNNPCTRSAHRLSAEGSLLNFRPYDSVHLAMLDDIRVLCSAKNPVEAISNAIKRFEPTHDVLVVRCVNKTLDILRDSGYAGEDRWKIVLCTQLVAIMTFRLSMP